MPATEPRVLVIDRAKWRVGGGSQKLKYLCGRVALRNEEGFLCCLGFDALACGVPEGALKDWSLPTSVDIEHPWVDALSRDDWAGDAMSINDDEPRRFSIEEREAKLIEHFKSHPLGPVDLRFEGDYLPEVKAILEVR